MKDTPSTSHTNLPDLVWRIVFIGFDKFGEFCMLFFLYTKKRDISPLLVGWGGGMWGEHYLKNPAYW